VGSYFGLFVVLVVVLLLVLECAVEDEWKTRLKAYLATAEPIFTA
jgi:hypothetical protein